MGSTPKEALKQLALGVAFRWLGLCYFYSSPACQQAPGTNSAASWGGARMWMWGAGISVAISRAGCGGCFRALYLLSG